MIRSQLQDTQRSLSLDVNISLDRGTWRDENTIPRDTVRRKETV